MGSPRYLLSFLIHQRLPQQIDRKTSVLLNIDISPWSPLSSVVVFVVQMCNSIRSHDLVIGQGMKEMDRMCGPKENHDELAHESTANGILKCMFHLAAISSEGTISCLDH
jgi:hypothetical protein